MICKKCGATIEDSSKFCGYCGEKISDTEAQSVEQSVVNNETNKISLEQTNLNQEVEQSIQLESQAPIEQNNTSNKESKNKKSNKIGFIILGITLAVLAIVLLILAFNKTSNNSISVLEKSLANLGSKGVNSGTINTKISIEDNTSNSINMSAVAKYTKTNDIYDFELTLNESMLFDEMSMYLRVTKDNVGIYANSSTIDLLGFTKSDVDTWVYYLMDLNEITEDMDISENETIDLKDILDQKHFRYVDSANNINHYKLIIDTELVEKLKAKMPSEYGEEIDSEFTLNDKYELDFYINDSDELVKISMDLTDTIGNNEIKSAVISFEFSNFGSTNVVIPSEALNSNVNIETYMSTNAIDSSIDDSGLTDEDFDINDDDFNLDINL